MFGFNGWGNVANRPDPITTHDLESTIKINESIFWSLQLALQDGDVSQCIRPYTSSGPHDTSDGWGANKSLKAWMETSENQQVMTLTLDKQLRKIIFYKGSIGAHINQWNKVMTYIVELDKNYYTEWRKLVQLKNSLQAKELQNMQELQVINKWDLKTFHVKLRTLEVVHQDDFGVINFSKYSAKNRTRFNPRTTTLALRRQTQYHMDDTVSECDKFDTANDQLQARRQNSDKHDKKYDKKKKTSRQVHRPMLADKHDAQ